MAKILVINPNSNEVVTQAISQGLDIFRVSDEVEIICQTLLQGPFGIESQSDIDAVINPLIDIANGSSDFDALVIACYSDPGLEKCRSVTDKPVLGIHESALLLATSSASKFGVLALSDVSIARHLKYQVEVGVADRLAGECAVNLTVDQGATDSRAFGLLYEAGQRLRDRDGADILILGCAGLAAHRSKLEDQLQMPVIDPTQAAVRQAVRLV